MVKPGGYLVTASKDGDGQLRRGGRIANLGVEYDGYWLPAHEMQTLITDAGFTVVFQGSQPPEAQETVAQTFLLARRTPR